ncbi:hypothetical protein LguiB_019747 [Lonicera macranthoides]
MAAPSPPVLPASTPQILPFAGGFALSNPPISTPAFRIFINHIIETINNGLSQLRPWAALANRSAFVKPESLFKASVQIHKNYSYFRVPATRSLSVSSFKNQNSLSLFSFSTLNGSKTHLLPLILLIRVFKCLLQLLDDQLYSVSSK